MYGRFVKFLTKVSECFRFLNLQYDHILHMELSPHEHPGASGDSAWRGPCFPSKAESLEAHLALGFPSAFKLTALLGE